MFEKKSYPIILGCIYLLSNYSAQGQMFLEQSASIGIDHEFQERALMGGGAVFFEYDNDNDDDLYLTSGLNRDHLYINNNDGTFTKDISNNGLFITIRYNTIGAGAADLDNDGDMDLLVTTWEWYDGSGAPIANNLLFNNNGDGTFDEISLEAGLDETAFSTGVAFLDIDKDGFLDIYIINYVDVPGFKKDSLGNVVGFDSDCYENFFYLNNGDMTFTEMSEELGINHEGCTLATIASDYDLDGDLDLYVANDYGPDILPNVFYENQYPALEFTDKSNDTGLDIAIYSMGVASADYDHDLDFDYYVTNLGKNALMNNRQGIFEHVSDAAMVGNEWVDEITFTTGWGAVFADVDNDSWEDLFVSNGRIASIPDLPTSITDPNKLYRNLGDGTFADISHDAGVSNSNYGRGVAFSDYDNDGDLDMVVVFLSEQGGRTQFYVNQGVDSAHYFQVRLTGVASNKDAIGAKVYLYAGETTLVKERFGGGSFCSQSSSVLHFGLGNSEIIDSLKIIWPSDHIDVIRDVAVDTMYAIQEFLDFNSSTEDVSLGQPGFSIYPNPAHDQFYIDLAGMDDSLEYRCRIYDLSSRMVRSWDNIREGGPFSLENINNGIYLVSLENNFTRRLQKLIISK